MPKISPEEKRREDAYAGTPGFTYHHSVMKDFASTNVWHSLKDVVPITIDPGYGSVTNAEVDVNDAESLEARAEELKRAAGHNRRISTMKEQWATNPEGLLSKLLDKAISKQALPKSSGLYALRADEMTDDLSWGPPPWWVGVVGAKKTRNSLILDINLCDELLRNEDTRRQAYGFTAASVAMLCIPYDRGKRHPLHSVVVQPDPAMQNSFTQFDYVLERLKRDQHAELASMKGSGAAIRAGVAAVKEAHKVELAEWSH